MARFFDNTTWRVRNKTVTGISLQYQYYPFEKAS